ncbi:hypothetical protein [Pleomorphovibrio marinus]|uniref:hypothetical protein n=1 Tax=Pleomorphovibrio marinus TaxID=2164132 RepID=UPI0013006656|nr:hypothetical protein [Pleomorphovibrio marinus]
MKTTGIRTTVCLTVLMASVWIYPSLVQGQSISTEIEQVRKFYAVPTEKGLIVLSREVRLKPDVDPKAFEKWIEAYWNLQWQDLIPGFQSYVAKREKDYSYYLVFNSNRIRNLNLTYSDKNTEWYREFLYYEPTKSLYDELFEYIEIDPFFTNIAWMEIK